MSDNLVLVKYQMSVFSEMSDNLVVIVGWASSQEAGTQNLLHQELEIEK